jgi:transposase
MAEQLGHKTERISMISGMSGGREGEIIAEVVFEGYCNSKLVGKWIEKSLVPELLPEQIVIIDNAYFHPVAKIKELLKPARCEVIFLPPYSLDLNKIEKLWALGQTKKLCESDFKSMPKSSISRKKSLFSNCPNQAFFCYRIINFKFLNPEPTHN